MLKDRYSPNMHYCGPVKRLNQTNYQTMQRKDAAADLIGWEVSSAAVPAAINTTDIFHFQSSILN